MQLVTFDTYEHIEKLKATGFAEPQAKAIVDAMKQAHTELATRNDLLLLRQEMRQMGQALDARIDSVEASLTARIDSVEASLTARIDSVEASLTARIGGVETRLEAKIDGVKSGLELQLSSFKADIIRWVIGLFFTQLGLLTGLLITLFKLFSH